MSALPAIAYIVGLVVFGLMYWILDGIKILFESVSESGDVYILCGYVWTGLLILYVIFGGVWLVRKYNEKQYEGGF